MWFDLEGSRMWIRICMFLLDGLKFCNPSKQIDVEDGTCGAKMALSDEYLSVFSHS